MVTYSAKVALLGNLIDYAGTFPPAALSLDKAMVEACTFRKTAKHPWLLARIVVTLADLKKLSPRAWFEAGSDGTPLPITVIGSPVEDPSEMPKTVGFEMREVRRFNERYVESSLRQRAVAYETKLPDDCPADAVAQILHSTLNAALQDGSLGMELYIEVPLSGDWQRRLSISTKAIAEWMEEHGSSVGSPGIKIRTGGKLTPGPEQLAEVVTTIASHGLKFKATQGLHHPYSQGTEYGFINLFAALAFTHALGTEAFGSDSIAKCLTAGGGDLKLGDALQWKDFKLDAEQIESARRRYGGTFGSCSVAEPDEFLQTEGGKK